MLRGARGWGWCSGSMLPRFAFGGLSRPVQSQLFSICFKATCKFRSLSACEIAWKSGKAGKCEAANSSCENCRLCTERERTILQCNHKNYAESKIKQKIVLPTDTCVNVPCRQFSLLYSHYNLRQLCATSSCALISLSISHTLSVSMSPCGLPSVVIYSELIQNIVLI